MKRILVTGGAGFIGSSLALELYKKGHEVTVFDSLSEQVHGSEPMDSPSFRVIDGCVNFIRGDIRCVQEVRSALEDNDYVFHLAAETGTGQSMYEVANYSEVNVQGTANLLQAIIEEKRSLKKLILASSRAVYGEGLYSCQNCGGVTPRPRSPQDMVKGGWSLYCPTCSRKVKPMATPESAAPDPLSIYGATKHTQEMLVRRVCLSFEISYVILRYQNVYGIGQSLRNPYTGVLAAFATEIMSGKAPQIFEDGTEARDFVHISDVTRANIASLEMDTCNNRILNIGSGYPTTIKYAAELLVKELDGEIRPVINGKFRVGDIYSCYADLSLAEVCIGYRPMVRIEEGIREFAHWARQQATGVKFLPDVLEEMAERGLYR